LPHPEISLQQIPSLFDRLTDEQQAVLPRHGKKRMFEAGEPLFQQGDPHDGIYLIQTGRVRSFY
jgi:CRP/FNR family transcriptional regulator, cyclic AMP receptor protein